jgi:serine/threonine-protein kinase
LEKVVLRCLAKDPARRYTSVADLAEALAPFASRASRTITDRIASLAAGARSSTVIATASSGPSRAIVENAVTVSAWNAKSPTQNRPVRYAAVGLAFFGIMGGLILVRRTATPREAATSIAPTTSDSSPQVAPDVAGDAAQAANAAKIDPSPESAASQGTASPSVVVGGPPRSAAPLAASHKAAPAGAPPVPARAKAAAPASAATAAPAVVDDLEERATSRRR